ncbi:response regulator transcription factor [Lentzea tibetensis]|uniref:Response regulator transcription factor n=1 Tax=Lentzea tibetensis TaxID=2591470 RepID=A0A563EVL2_9PSEU|nr:response regulator transcription factor [Lentzea tibetensis]TWP51693.1 response regulator transcription factor [Lentzea tibetensis]
MSAPPIRVVIVEDHDMVAEAIALALERSNVRVTARADTMALALAEVTRHRPDVVVLDRRLPDGDGIDLIGELAALGARVLVLTAEATAAVATRVAETGGSGLLLKSSKLDELVVGVHRVASGEAVFDSRLLAGVLDRLTGRVDPAGAALTEREQQTLFLLADGASTREIGVKLGIAHNTVRNHIRNLLQKLGARSKLEAVSIARRQGVID